MPSLATAAISPSSHPHRSRRGGRDFARIGFLNATHIKELSDA